MRSEVVFIYFFLPANTKVKCLCLGGLSFLLGMLPILGEGFEAPDIHPYIPLQATVKQVMN